MTTAEKVSFCLDDNSAEGMQTLIKKRCCSCKILTKKESTLDGADRFGTQTVSIPSKKFQV
ncbi:hypothetical protein K8354_07000 [Polaribacter litorisediminis]|uniref:hypothetical protein n=1 Tax=Polaribacter litorisediminis TaxID=1908341 RepID=UPI001CBCBC8E|nr:hypothetical protein K8354_07000 [Polaribacter litorisediminis]